MTSPQSASPPSEYSTLYEQDYAAWLLETATLLRAGKLDAVDITNLAEELEDMGHSEKRAVKSNLEVLLRHLLKYQYQPQLRSISGGLQFWSIAIVWLRPLVIVRAYSPTMSACLGTLTSVLAKKPQSKLGFPSKLSRLSRLSPLKRPSILTFFPILTVQAIANSGAAAWPK